MHPKHHHHKPKASSSVALNLLPGWLSAPSYNSTFRPGPCNCWSSQLKKEVGLTCHSLEAHSLEKVCNAFVTCLGFKHIGVLQIHEKRIASVLWAGFKFQVEDVASSCVVFLCMPAMFVSGPLFLPREKVEVHVGNFIVLARESTCLHCRRIHFVLPSICIFKDSSL